MANTKTYSDLVADVTDWLKPLGGSTDLASIIPTFIMLAEELHTFGDEKQGFPGLRIKEMLKRSRAIGQSDTYLPYPSDYLEMRNMRIVKASASRDDGKLDQVPHESLDRSVSGEPTQFALGREIELNASASSTVIFEMLYYAPFTPLDSGSNNQNWLLNNMYSAYLYGTLLHAAPYLGDDEASQTWASAYMQSVNRLQGTDNRGRAHKGQIKVSLGTHAGP